MGKVIRSKVFGNGYLSYTPDDPWESFICSHPNRFAWLSGSAVNFRGFDNIWDDYVDESKAYYSPVQTEDKKPTTSMRVGNMPSIEIKDDGHLHAGFVIPESYTIFLSAVADVKTTGLCLFGGPTNASPRLYFGTNSGSHLTLTHSSSAGSSVASGENIVLGEPFVAWARYDAVTKTGSIGVNKVTGAANVFSIDHPAIDGAGIGAFMNGANPFVGAFGDLGIMNAAISDTDLAIIIEGLALRAQVALT